MKMKTAAVMASLMVAIAVQAASPIGTVVESIVNVLQRRHIAPDTVQTLTFVDLDNGVWSVSGVVTYFFQGVEGEIMFLAGGIELSPTLTLDGTTTIDSTVIALGRADTSVPLPSRALVVRVPPNQTKRVYLMGWFLPGTPRTSDFYGFLSAHKIDE